MKAILDFVKGITNRIDANKIMIAFLAAFLLDQLVNYFIDFPVYILGLMILLPVIIVKLKIVRNFPKSIAVLIIFISVVAIIGVFRYSFVASNFADVFLIISFPLSMFFFLSQRKTLNHSLIYIAFAVFVAFISFSFLDFNKLNTSNAKQIVVAKENKKKQEGIQETREIIKRKQTKLNKIETERKYRNGLFRIPHVASYMFGYTLLFFLFLISKRNRILLNILLAVVSIILMLIIGVRTYFFAVLISLFLFTFRRKFIGILSFFSLLGIVMILFRMEILQFLEGSVFEPYFGTIVTAIDNFSGFSRLLFYKSWWREMLSFEWYDFFIGKTLVSSYESNLLNLKFCEWFHSDLASITYSYGIVVFVVYLYAFIASIKLLTYKVFKNAWIFTLFGSMIFAALINGQYHYFAPFLSFVFALMINIQEKKRDEVIDFN